MTDIRRCAWCGKYFSGDEAYKYDYCSEKCYVEAYEKSPPPPKSEFKEDSIIEFKNKYLIIASAITTVILSFYFSARG